MDRRIVYSGAIPQDTDVLMTNKYAMLGLSKLAHAILGDGPWMTGLGCVPTAPASLQVQVNPGQIYQLNSVDATAFGSVAADTSHQILKQGILLDAVTLSCPAPGTAGQSINYLVEVGYLDSDTGSTVLPYYNSANPAQAFNGPNNNGTSQTTIRQGVCSVQVKVGTAAATGSQTTPSPDAGYVGAYVVTVANGQTTITSSNITQYSGAPFIPTTLTGAAGLNLANVFSLPQTVPNGTAAGHAINKGQADANYAPLFPGKIEMYGGATAPSGYLLCDGSAVSRTTYSALYSAIGTAFGVGDGSTTFNVPDLRSRSPIGAGTGTGLTNRTLGTTGGNETHTLTQAETPVKSHTHGVTDPGHVHNLLYNASAGGSNSLTVGAATTAGLGGLITSSTTGITIDAASDATATAHDIMNPWTAVNFIIKT